MVGFLHDFDTSPLESVIAPVHVSYPLAVRQVHMSRCAWHTYVLGIIPVPEKIESRSSPYSSTQLFLNPSCWAVVRCSTHSGRNQIFKNNDGAGI
jgi:hypothetical protein